MEIKIKTRSGSIFNAVMSLLKGSLFIAIGIYLFHRNKPFSLLMILASIRFSIYQMMDLWVNKTFIIEGDSIFIKCWGIRFKLDKEKSFLRIEDMLVLNSINARYPSLNIYRNSSSILSKLFKNKIKLYVVTKDSIEHDEKEALELSEMLGIRFMNVYSF